MLRSFEQLREKVGAAEPKNVAVACAHDAHTLEAVLQAAAEGMLRYTLIGDKEAILRIGRELGHEIPASAVIHTDTDEEAAGTAVRLVREGAADFIQKGLMQTATLLKAVVNKETGIGQGRPMSHTALLEVPGYHKLLGVTDGGMIPSPDLETKKEILRNAVDMFRQMGVRRLRRGDCQPENRGDCRRRCPEGGGPGGRAGQLLCGGPHFLRPGCGPGVRGDQGVQKPCRGRDGHPAGAEYGGGEHHGQGAD